MKVSEIWLREFFDKNLSTNELSELFTMAGLEVDAIESSRANFSGVVIAKVVSCEKLTGSEKLSVCKVDDGSDGLKQVVCGAANVKANHYYPYARIGASLGNQQNIECCVIKDVESQGMLCSAHELGLSDSSNGLYEIQDEAMPGVDLHEFLSFKDEVFDISLTPNRGDCLSVVGLVREIGALSNSDVKHIDIEHVSNEIQDKLEIFLEEPEACPRYSGRIIQDIDAKAITPNLIQERLRRSGIRSINIIVDLTNYVMLEMGQPMHAFDLDKLNGNIHVRLAEKQETITLLDDEKYSLSENTLVISDDSGAIAMAGVMGGEATSVSTDTRSVFLESAFFTPTAIMGRARKYGLHTDASHRFERGVDPQLTYTALERLTSLLIQYCGGRPGPVVDATSSKHIPVIQPVSLRKARVTNLLGLEIEDSKIIEILGKLGFTFENEEDGWLVSVPSYRFDIEQEVDLIEEIARVHGYHQIDESLPAVTINLSKNHGLQSQQSLLINIMVAMGYTEVITYSFVDASFQARLGSGSDELTLLNPISADMSVMRDSLLPGLLMALQYNVKRQQNRLRIFEMGRCFESRSEKITEKNMLSGLSYGNIYKKQWGIEDISSDFYYIKADLESILFQFLNPGDISYKKSAINALHPHQNAEIFYKNQKIGYVGTLNPKIQSYLDMPERIQVFEVDIGLIPWEIAKKYVKISKFPSIRRDISVIVDEELPANEVINCINTVGAELLDNLELFDVYQGEGIDLGKKSLALGLTFRRSSSTLTDEEADIVVNDVLRTLQNQFGAILRE